MAEISWDFLASRFTIRPSQPTDWAGERSVQTILAPEFQCPVRLEQRLRRLGQKTTDLYDFAVYSLER